MPAGARVRQQTPPAGGFTSPGTVHERAGVPGLPPQQRSNEPSNWPPPAVPSPRGQADDSTIDEQPSISVTPQPPQLPPPPMAGMQPMARPPTAPPPMPPMQQPMMGQSMQPPMQPAMGQLPTQQPVFPPSQPNMQSPAPGGYPMWGVQPQLPPLGASPPTPDLYDRPVYPQRPSVPVVGFDSSKRESSLKTWVLIVGALVMAGLAFAITRLFLTV
jgi:hypothetical protein